MVRWLANRAAALGGGNRLMLTIYIYALVDPITWYIRYIGQSNRPIRRYDEHLDDNDDTPKVEWIKGLRRKGLKPILVILFRVPKPLANITEHNYIDQFKVTPWGLTNSTFNGPRKRKSRVKQFFTIDRHEAWWLFKWSIAIVAAIALILFIIGP